MKPIIKKYENKDLNIAYNDGYNQAKKEFVKELFLKKENFGKEKQKIIQNWNNYICRMGNIKDEDRYKKSKRKKIWTEEGYELYQKRLEIPKIHAKIELLEELKKEVEKK